MKSYSLKSKIGCLNGAISAKLVRHSFHHGAPDFAGSLEAGYPFRLANGFFIEPQAQMVYLRVNLADASNLFADVQFDRGKYLAGRLGARFGRIAHFAEVAASTTWGSGSTFGGECSLSQAMRRRKVYGGELSMPGRWLASFGN